MKGKFDTRQLEEGRNSAVHYLRFSLAVEEIVAFRAPASEDSLRVDHRAYQVAAPHSPATRELPRARARAAAARQPAHRRAARERPRVRRDAAPALLAEAMALAQKCARVGWSARAARVVLDGGTQPLCIEVLRIA